MGGFLLRKVGAALIVLLLASMLVFLGVRALPGDPALALGGENRDPAVHRRRSATTTASTSRCRCSTSQWLGHALQGDLGQRPAQALGRRTRS